MGDAGDISQSDRLRNSMRGDVAGVQLVSPACKDLMAIRGSVIVNGSGYEFKPGDAIQTVTTTGGSFNQREVDHVKAPVSTPPSPPKPGVSGFLWGYNDSNQGMVLDCYERKVTYNTTWFSDEPEPARVRDSFVIGPIDIPVEMRGVPMLIKVLGVGSFRVTKAEWLFPDGNVSLPISSTDVYGNPKQSRLDGLFRESYLGDYTHWHDSRSFGYSMPSYFQCPDDFLDAGVSTTKYVGTAYSHFQTFGSYMRSWTDPTGTYLGWRYYLPEFYYMNGDGTVERDSGGNVVYNALNSHQIPAPPYVDSDGKYYSKCNLRVEVEFMYGDFWRSARPSYNVNPDYRTQYDKFRDEVIHSEWGWRIGIGGFIKGAHVVGWVGEPTAPTTMTPLDYVYMKPICEQGSPGEGTNYVKVG